MIPLANSGAIWREPKSVAVRADRIVVAENSDGTWSFMSVAEAATLGGAVAVWEEESDGVYALTPIGSSDASARRLGGARVHTTPKLVVVEDTDGTWLLAAPAEAARRGGAVAVFEETAARSGIFQLTALTDVAPGRARAAPVAVLQTTTFI